MSGAKLFLIYFADGGLPFLFKVAPLDKAKEEFLAIGKLRDFVRDCKLERHKLFESDGWGGLLYQHFGTDDAAQAENVETLSNIAFCEEAKCPRANLTKVIAAVYRELNNAHRHSTWSVCSIDDLYGRYFRKNCANRRIAQVLGPNSKAREFMFLEADIFNPLIFFSERPAEGAFHVASVHGDLHSDNIILAKDLAPRLIDFAWAHDARDMLVDFVLFESSLRFRDFPRPANLHDQYTVDFLFLKDDPIDEISKLDFSNDQARHKFTRLAVIVSRIRREARQLLGSKFISERYLFAQFLVLYGLLAYEQYEPYTSIRALGIIARHLQSKGWDFLKA